MKSIGWGAVHHSFPRRFCEVHKVMEFYHAAHDVSPLQFSENFHCLAERRSLLSKCPKRMRMSHNSLACWPPPCSKSRFKSRSSSRWNRVWISAWEFSWQNHHSPGSLSPYPFSLTSASNPPELPGPLSPPSHRGGWPLWFPSLPKGFFLAILPSDSKPTCTPLRLPTIHIHWQWRT